MVTNRRTSPKRTRSLIRGTRNFSLAAAVFAMAVLAGAGIYIVRVSHADAQTVIWNGDMETGDFSQWQWNKALEWVPGRINVYSAITQPSWPAPRQGNYAARIDVDGEDFRGESTGARAQLDGPDLFKEGDDSYLAWSTYFPSNFPAVPTGSWFSFAELYGDGTGSPYIGFQVHGNTVIWTRDQAHNYDVPWTTPLIRGQWNDFVIHVKYSHTENVGFVELWYNGHLQTFSDGSTKKYGATLRPGDTVVYPVSQSYREFDSIPGLVTLYEDAFKAGTTYASVDPAGGATSTPTPSASPQPKSADLTGDGHINVFDLSYLLAKWGTGDTKADLNSSGNVDVFDLSALLSKWTG